MTADAEAEWRHEYDEWMRACAERSIADAQAFGAEPLEHDRRLVAGQWTPDWNDLSDLPAGFRRLVTQAPRTYCMDDILVDDVPVGAVSKNDDLEMWQAHDVTGAIIGRTVSQAAAVVMVVHRAGHDGLVEKADDGGR